MAGRPKLPDEAKKVKLSIAVSPEVEEVARNAANISQLFDAAVRGMEALCRAPEEAEAIAAEWRTLTKGEAPPPPFAGIGKKAKRKR